MSERIGRPMLARYTLDPGPSRFTVQAFAAGMLSFLGHNPTFAVRDFAGEVTFDPAPADGASIRVVVRADSLALLDKVSAADRRQIEETMRGEALETAKHPEIAFEAAGGEAGAPAGDARPLHVAGRLTLHGVTRPHRIDARLTLYSDGVRLAGGFLLSQSEYGIRPVTALGGTLKLRDPVKVSFDVVGWKKDD